MESVPGEASQAALCAALSIVGLLLVRDWHYARIRAIYGDDEPDAHRVRHRIHISLFWTIATVGAAAL